MNIGWGEKKMNKDRMSRKRIGGKKNEEERGGWERDVDEDNLVERGKEGKDMGKRKRR